MKASFTAPFRQQEIEFASEKQREAFEYLPLPLCCSGGFGASKTYALCLKALWLCDTFPRNRGVIGRKVAKELSLTTQSTFFKICPPQAYDARFGGRRADSENYLRLAHSGSEILWLHLDDQDVDKVIRGLEINWFLLDQAEEIEESIFDTLMTRLGRWDQAVVPQELIDSVGGIENWTWKNAATGRPIPPTYPMIACNPDAETHWIWRRFHPDSRDWKERYSKDGYKMISMPFYENKFLPKANLEEMMRRDPTWVRRFVHAEWGIPEGAIHNVRKESIVPGTRAIVDFIRNRCRLHRALDHGDAAPTCCIWWANDSSGNVFFYREYYRPNALVSEHRRNITRMSQDEKYVSNLADPSMFFKVQQKHGGRASFADDYEDRNPAHGFDPTNCIYWSPADNDELGTRNLINEYLRLQGTGELHRGQERKQFGDMWVEPGQEIPRVHPITGQYGYWPRLYFIEKSEDWPEGCEYSIQQMRSQRRIQIGSEMGEPIFSDDRDESITDHAYDPVRYAIASRAATPTTKSARYGKKSFFGQRDALLAWKKRGGREQLRSELEKSYG